MYTVYLSCAHYRFRKSCEKEHTTFPFFLLILDTQSAQITGALFVAFFHLLLFDNFTYSPLNGSATLKKFTYTILQKLLHLYTAGDKLNLESCQHLFTLCSSSNNFKLHFETNTDSLRVYKFIATRSNLYEIQN